MRVELYYNPENPNRILKFIIRVNKSPIIKEYEIFYHNCFGEILFNTWTYNIDMDKEDEPKCYIKEVYRL